MADERELPLVISAKDELSRPARKMGDSLDDLADKAEEADEALTKLSKNKGPAGGKGGDPLKATKNIFAGIGDALSSIPKKAGDAFSAIPAEAQMALAGVGSVLMVTLSGFIASAIAAGVLLGLGGGVLAAGIALAVKDQRVQDAFLPLGKQVMGSLQQASKVFVGPLQESAKTFGKAWAEVAPVVSRIFALMSRAVLPIAEGLSGLVKNMMPGLEKAIKAALPLFVTLGKQLPNIGNALKSFFESMAKAGPGAEKAFRFLLIFFAKTIVIVGEIIEFLAKAYDWIMRVFGAEGVDTKGLEQAGLDAAHALTGVGTEADRAASSVDSLNNEFQTWLSNSLGLEAASDGVKRAFREVAEEFKSGSKSLRDNTEAGLDNREVIRQAIEGFARFREAQLAAGVAASTANANFLANVEALRNQLYALGLNKKEVDAYIDSLLKIPKEIQTKLTVKAEFRGFQDVQTAMDVRLGRRAAGGPVDAGVPYLVGEAGSEIFVPTTNGAIIPHHDIMRSATSAAGPSSVAGGETTVRILVEGDGVLSSLRREIRVKGGNVQEVLGPYRSR